MSVAPLLWLFAFFVLAGMYAIRYEDNPNRSIKQDALDMLLVVTHFGGWLFEQAKAKIKSARS